MDQVDLYLWCEQRVAAFREYEEREMALWPTDAHRDRGLVEETIRTLANPEVPESADVLRQITERRTGEETRP